MKVCSNAMPVIGQRIQYQHFDSFKTDTADTGTIIAVRTGTYFHHIRVQPDNPHLLTRWRTTENIQALISEQLEGQAAA